MMQSVVSRFRHVLALAAALGWLAGAPVAASPVPQEPETVTSASVDDDELERFTRGLMMVQEIQTNLKEQIGQTQDPTAAQVMQEQANTEMAEGIADLDLTVERYNQLARSLSADPALNQRVLAMQAELLADR